MSTFQERSFTNEDFNGTVEFRMSDVGFSDMLFTVFPLVAPWNMDGADLTSDIRNSRWF